MRCLLRKSDKVTKKEAKKIHDDVFGDNDNNDEYDDVGKALEDEFSCGVTETRC